ncbi:ATP-dependent Clp protease ATP-binding subunit [Candidatus Berkelbacteria bacterium]|nr:ATP-dependent Clp protease ATP-binding subunit [Candidatus Berkelbacteria bacterium]
MSWHFQYAVRYALNIWQTAIILVFDDFSIPFLLRTLFYPWKKDFSAPADASLQAHLEAFAANLIARLIGGFIRFFTILTGFSLILLIILSGLPLFILFFLSPFLPPLLPFVFLLFHHARQNPPLPFPLTKLPEQLEKKQNLNLTPFLEERARFVLSQSRDWGLFLKTLFAEDEIRFIFLKLNLNPSLFLNLQPPERPKFTKKTVVELAYPIAIKNQHQRILSSDLLLAWAAVDGKLKTILSSQKLTYQDLENAAFWKDQYFAVDKPPSFWLNPSQIKGRGGIGRDWAAGYTPFLDKVSMDLTAAIETHPNFLHFEAHKNISTQIEQVLARSGKHNVILIGEPGTGKRTAVLSFARKVIFGEVLRSLSYKKIRELDLNRLISLSGSSDGLERHLILALTEAVRSGNIILFIDQIERLFSGAQKLGTVDAAEILIPFMERDDFQLLATTNYNDYHRLVEPNSNLSALFEKIEISATNVQETIRVLEEISPTLEYRHKIIVTYPSVVRLVTLAERYVTNRFNPEKSIDLLDEAMVFAAKMGLKKLLPSHIDELMKTKTGIPVAEANQGEKETLLHLEEIIHRRLINQEEAVSEIARAMRRGRAGIHSPDKPIGTFLFLGPTGVGKTETARALAKGYFGSEKQMIRFEMAEFNEADSESKILQFLTNEVKERPFSLLLLDEMEKASLGVKNIFLSILDEGRLKDQTGRMVSFANTIIIATSNAGSEIIRQRIKAGLSLEGFREKLVDTLLRERVFAPEFLNRFDAVVAFRPLSETELIKVVEIKLILLNQRMADRQIKIELTSLAKQKIARLGFNPEFGARALVRVLQDKVENLVAEKILREELKAGETLIINEKMF